MPKATVEPKAGLRARHETIVRHEVYIHLPPGILPILNQLKEIAMVTAADVKSIQTQVEKIGTETQNTLQKVTDLQAVIDSQGGTTPEIQAAFDDLKASVQKVDDLIPDAAP